ncbi:hypothetical protein EPO15_09130 [bacterium]|nr:MAG: hypothetical protein EPO15_09130 [bacterium]
MLLAALLAWAAAATAATRTPLPPSDMALDMRMRMERIEPQAKALADLDERLVGLAASYADGRDPDAPGSGRAELRREAEQAAARLKESVSDFWKEAEGLRVAAAADFLFKTAAGKKTQAVQTAAVLSQPPAFPKLAMHVYHISQVTLAYEEAAARDAKKRRAEERNLRLWFGLGGLALGLLISVGAAVYHWAASPPAAGALTKT